ncbi:hypothetical protein HLH44_05335 [Gluconacetobacter sp. 1c LMG 22058]|uniref:Transposase DDE domain-containing protein n=1 Tax=Gluconacetobacter dulcium TaxID=2729096 RepID=A0A7W4JY48_9PROT|nr:hypothetical protein [Gluconacetobacter dulcium]
MQTECSAGQLAFGEVSGRRIVADFAGGTITSDAGALLLGAADRAIGLTERFACCFTDTRAAHLVEHDIRALVLQRVAGIALRYEDLVDHDHLRHDPVLAILPGKLDARRARCALLAGKCTLNRLELSHAEPGRYHRIKHDPSAIEARFVDIFLDAHRAAPGQIVLDLDATDDPVHGHQEGRFFHGYYDRSCYLPLSIFCGRHLLASKLRPSNRVKTAPCAALLARLRRLQKQPALQLLGKRVQTARTLWNLELHFRRLRPQIFADRVARQLRPALDLADRQMFPVMPPTDHTR